MQRIVWNELDRVGRRAALARPNARIGDELVQAVRAIVDDVRACGWHALVEQAIRIDGQEPREVDTAPLADRARGALTSEQLAAIELARENVARFHEAVVPADRFVETQPGLSVGKLWRPIDRAGLYVPGGNAPLFSTLLMLALPAKAARVRDIVVCSPPNAEGSVHPVIALAAQLCGIESVWAVGGAQAIAAMAFGAGEIGAVDKICGPGNAYVAAAKSYVAANGGPAIDMPAGPSELLVIADEGASPATVAADLLSQAEHDRTAQVLLVTPSVDLRRCGMPEPSSSARSTRPSRSPTLMRRSISAFPSRIRAHWLRRSATPGRSLPATMPPNPSATIWPGRATCCRPMAQRAHGAVFRCIVS
jgi:histidinol dehydrogenase